MCAIRRVVYILVCALVPLPPSELATTSIHASPIHVHTPVRYLKQFNRSTKPPGCLSHGKVCPKVVVDYMMVQARWGFS